MKKIYTLLSLVAIGSLALSNKAAAQITVTDADMPTVGTTFVTSFDTASALLLKVSPGAKGNTSWNYSTLSVSYRDTTLFVTPSSTPYSASFSGANLADTVFNTAGYNYVSSTSSKFSIIGSEQNVQGVMAAIVFNPPVTELNFPAKFGNTDGGSTVSNTKPVAFTAFPGADSAKGVIHETYADTIDAYGSLTTPLYGGTTYSTLRQKHYQVDIDSIFLHNTATNTWSYFSLIPSTPTKSYQYRWFANGLGDMAAMMQMDSTGTIATSFQWYSGLPDGINELNQAHYTLAYPNPATRQISFRYSAQNAQNIFVYDMAGRQIGQVEMKNGMATINTSAFANGIYFYHVTDKSGNVLDNGKFSVL